MVLLCDHPFFQRLVSLSQDSLGVDNFAEDGGVQACQVVFKHLLFDPQFVLLLDFTAQFLDVLAAFQEFVVQRFYLVIFRLDLQSGF